MLSVLAPVFASVSKSLVWLSHLFIIFLGDPHTPPATRCLPRSFFVGSGSQAAISAVPDILPHAEILALELWPQ